MDANTSRCSAGRFAVLVGIVLVLAAATVTWATPGTEASPPAAEEPDAAATAAPGDEPLAAEPAPEQLGLRISGLISPTWTHTIGGPGWEFGYDVVATARRTVYVTGLIGEVGAPWKWDLSLAKIVDGKRVWLKTYDGPAHDDDWGTATAARGNAIYTAGVRTSVRGDEDLLLIRWDPNGNRVWAKAYDSGYRLADRAVGVAVDGDGNVTVVGWSALGGPNFGWVVISYKADGTRRWVQRYEGPAHRNDRPQMMRVDAGGNVYVVGLSTSLRGDPDALTIKYAKSGTRLWTRRYNGPASGKDYANALRLRPGGGVYVAGAATNVTSGEDGLLLAYTAAGTRLFATLDPGPDPMSPIDQSFEDLEVLPDGTVLCGGGTESPTWGIDQYHASFDAARGARLVWTTKGTPYDDRITCMAKDAQGGVYLCGCWGTGSTTSQISVERIRAGGANWESHWPVTLVGGYQLAAIAVNGVNAYIVGTHSVSPSDDEQVVLGYVY